MTVNPLRIVSQQADTTAQPPSFPSRVQQDTSGAAPLLLRACDLARLLGISVRSAWRLDSSGRVPRPLRIGGAVRWRAEEISDWVRDGCPSRLAWNWKGARE